MKKILLLTTALCGFYAVDARAATGNVTTGTITTTTTEVWTQDFPDSEPRIEKSEKTEENCDEYCIVYVEAGSSAIVGGIVKDSVSFSFAGDKTKNIFLAHNQNLKNLSKGKKFNIDDSRYDIAINHDLINEIRELGIGGVTKKDSKTGCIYIRGNSCFDYNTLVQMSDGSAKKIGEIVAGDETAYGVVRQTFIRRFDQSRTMEADFQASYNGGLYNYRGVLVTGNHAVRDGDRWMQVADTRDAVPASFDETATVGNVYNLDIEGGVIPVVNPDGELIAFLDDKQAFALHHLAA